MTNEELVERLRVWFRMKGDLALKEAAERLERLDSALLNIALMDCYTREGEEPIHLLMMRLADEARQ